VNLATLVPLLLKTSIALSVFCLGLETTAPDLTYLIRNPVLLIRSLLAMIVVVPIFAVFLALALNLHPAVKIALLALALSPVPPKMPRKAAHASGHSSYAIALLATVSILSMVWVPLGVEAVGKVFRISIHMGAAPVLALVSVTILGPLLLGMLVAGCAPALGSRTVKPLSVVSTTLLVVAVVPILFTALPVVVSLLTTGTIVSILFFILAGLVAGHFLGGPSEGDRAVLAISSAFRHPGIAIAIAAATFPAQKSASAAVVLYLLFGFAMSQAYERWMRRRVQ
jgi:bile acid:Na+ symporter, BASS family